MVTANPLIVYGPVLGALPEKERQAILDLPFGQFGPAMDRLEKEYKKQQKLEAKNAKTKKRFA